MTLSPLSGSGPQAPATPAVSSQRLRLRQTLPLETRPQAPTEAQAARAANPLASVWQPAPLAANTPAVNAAPHPDVSADRPMPASASQGPQPPEAVFREVSALAESMGYVGLTRTALARAMTQGTSLLADVRA